MPIRLRQPVRASSPEKISALLPESSSAPTVPNTDEHADRSASPPFLSRQAPEDPASTLATNVSRDVLLPEQIEKSVDQI